MGKRIIPQRRGKGTPTYRANSQHFKAKSRYRNIDDLEKEKVKAEVEELIHDPARTTLLMKLRYENGEVGYLPAPEGIAIGQEVTEGYQAQSKTGNVVPLEKIPEGFPIFNIEINPGDGGKLAKSSGSVSWIVSKKGNKAKVKLPSKKTKEINLKCRATIGKASGGGRTDKPMLKAGVNFHKKKAKGKKYPTVRGVKMNAVDHPFGGKEHHHAVTKKGKMGSPGQHVGSFGSKSTGRKKK